MCCAGSRTSRTSVSRDGRSSSSSTGNSRMCRHKSSHHVADVFREKKIESAAQSKSNSYSYSYSYSPLGHNEKDDLEADALQITPYHAFLFILLSSSFLLVMYFINIISFVSILYLFSAGYASADIFFIPFFNRLTRTCTAIQHNIKIEHVSEASSEDDVFGINPSVICSGMSCMQRQCY